MTNHQRSGSLSNSHVGKEFEVLASRIFISEGISLIPNFSILVGVSSHKKAHKFDLGSNNPKLLVECKSHTWTAGDRTPSSKIKNWSEAMYYFFIAPEIYRKIFFIQKSVRSSTGETLAEYYIRTHYHLIPDSVEFWEYDIQSEYVRKNLNTNHSPSSPSPNLDPRKHC